MRSQVMRLALENAFVDVHHPSHDDALIMSFRKEFGHLYPTPPVVVEHNPIGRPYLVMEEIANGQPVKEIEHTIYAKVVSPSELERAASKENQEQWEIRVPKDDKNAGDGSMRVRKTWQDGKEEEAVYVRTSKVKMNDNGDKIELPLPSNKDEFTIFKFLSGQGMRKVRFTFPIIGTDLKWEIDMFPKPDGEGYYDWCKIDLEVRDRNQPIPEFPIALSDVILPEGYGRPTGGNEEGIVRDLYDQFFLLKNEFLKKPSTDPVEVQSAQNNDGLATSEQASLPNDPGADQTLGQVQKGTEGSDEPPAQAVAQTPAAPSSTDIPEHEQLSQALNEGVPGNLQIDPEPKQDQGQGQAENPAPEQGTAANPEGNAIPGEPNGAEPNGGATTPEQAESNQQPEGLTTKGTGTEPTPDGQVDAQGPAEGETGEGEQTEAQQEHEEHEEQQEQQQQAQLDQTQLKVDEIQKEKQAEAQAQGKPDPTEGGKVPVDLIDNPQGDPSVATPPGETNEGSESTDGDDTTGAADGTNPEVNPEGTGDGLGGELAGGAGTTGTDDNSLGENDVQSDGTQGEGGDVPTANAMGEGETNAEATGQDLAAAAAPEKATAGEMPAENAEQNKRPNEEEQ
jgi:hypothetical protein